MKPRPAIGFCAVVVGLSGLTVCQPPQPRIAVVEGRTSEAVASTGSTEKDILAAFDHPEEPARAGPSGGLLTRSSKHDSPRKLGNAETLRIGKRSARVVFQLGTPVNPELAMGVLAETGYQYLNEDVIRGYGVSAAQLEEEIRHQNNEIDRMPKAEKMI